jgi:hypothetical protein
VLKYPPRARGIRLGFESKKESADDLGSYPCQGEKQGSLHAEQPDVQPFSLSDRTDQEHVEGIAQHFLIQARSLVMGLSHEMQTTTKIHIISPSGPRGLDHLIIVPLAQPCLAVPNSEPSRDTCSRQLPRLVRLDSRDPWALTARLTLDLKSKTVVRLGIPSFRPRGLSNRP